MVLRTLPEGAEIVDNSDSCSEGDDEDHPEEEDAKPRLVPETFPGRSKKRSRSSVSPPSSALRLSSGNGSEDDVAYDAEEEAAKACLSSKTRGKLRARPNKRLRCNSSSSSTPMRLPPPASSSSSQKRPRASPLQAPRRRSRRSTKKVPEVIEISDSDEDAQGAQKRSPDGSHTSAAELDIPSSFVAAFKLMLDARRSVSWPKFSFILHALISISGTRTVRGA